MPLSLAGKAAAAALALGSVGAYELAPTDTRGQTVFLERLAHRVDHARAIAPETATRISALLARVRAKPARDADLDGRREQAIGRIESALQAKASLAGGELAAQSSPVARR
jgi:hypothetical protein